MKTLIVVTFFLGSLLAMGQETLKEKPVGREISGVVRLIRANPKTEVFFKDGKESVFIANDSKHNAIFELCEESQKKGLPIKLTVHPISREVLEIPGKAEQKTGPAQETSLPESTK